MSLNHLKLYLSKEIIEKKDEKRKVELIGALLKAGCERSNIFVDKISEEKSERLGLTHPSIKILISDLPQRQFVLSIERYH